MNNSSHISNKEYSVMFGSPHHYPFLKCLFVMYERIRLAKKIIEDKVEQDFIENKDAVLHSYKGYMKSQDRIRENRGLKEQSNGNAGDHVGDETTIKEKVSRHRLAILIGIAITKSKSKLDTTTFEELIRVFLGVKAFFFFTFDKLIGVASKAFHSLFNEEYQKSAAFNLYQKYNKLGGDQRNKLHELYF